MREVLEATTDLAGEAGAVEAVSTTILRHPIPTIDRRRSHRHDRHHREMLGRVRIKHGGQASGLEQVLGRRQHMRWETEGVTRQEVGCLEAVLRARIQEDFLVDGDMILGREAPGQAQQARPTRQVGTRARALDLPADDELANEFSNGMIRLTIFDLMRAIYTLQRFSPVESRHDPSLLQPHLHSSSLLTPNLISALDFKHARPVRTVIKD